jgi:ABC-type transport system involved in cytochrome c biogenesis ATPase subunit
VHGLDVAQQQMMAISKALSQNARVLVLDEPTAALSDRETERLFELIAAPARDSGNRQAADRHRGAQPPGRNTLVGANQDPAVTSRITHIVMWKCG